MLISLVIDPAVFHKDAVARAEVLRGLTTILAAIVSNGVVIDSSDSTLLNAYRRHAEVLNVKGSQSIRIFLAEILKNKKKYVAKSREPLALQSNAEDLRGLFRLGEVMNADAIVTIGPPPKPPTALCSIQVEAYPESETERKRTAFLSLSSTVDVLGTSAREDLIGRCLRYAECVRFYDYAIGISQSSRKPEFCRGIEYILDLWRRVALVANPVTMQVEIITVVRGRGRDPTSPEKRIEQVKSKIVAPLRKRFGGSINVSFKDDSSRVFHARFLESKRWAFLVDPGFDFLDRHGKWNRTFWILASCASQHLAEVRALDNFQSPVST